VNGFHWDNKIAMVQTFEVFAVGAFDAPNSNGHDAFDEG
jgi:hypothetical protein